MVEKRQKLLQYLGRKNFGRYNELVRVLGIRPIDGIKRTRVLILITSGSRSWHR